MAHPLAPTTVLPALAVLRVCDAARVREALHALRDLYFPSTSLPKPTDPVLVSRQSLSDAVRALRPTRKTRLVQHDYIPDSGYASAEEDAFDPEEDEELAQEALDILRSDELERGYTIKWLTGLVKRGDAWLYEACNASMFEEQEARTTCIDEAAKLLARFSGNDVPEEAITRTFVFPFNIPSSSPCHRRDIDALSSTSPVTVELNDAPVDGTDHTAVGLQSWGSAIIFAQRMCSDPERYLGTLAPYILTTPEGAKASTTPRRILELGAGTGLLSITAAQILSRTSARGEINATDYHPSVLDNLTRNVSHNRSATPVLVEQLDWRAASCIKGVYDVVLAADVVYHPEHARWIKGCVEQMLKKGGVFWLVIPVRTIGRHAELGKTVEEAFPVVYEEGGDRLAIVRREHIERVNGVGRADEGGYSLLEIRWM